MIYITLHRKLKIEQHKTVKTEVNTGASEGLAVPVPHVTPVVLLRNETNSI
jgi:hypothetical protein